MKQFFYCNACDAIVKTRVVEKEQTLVIKGLEITLNAQVRVCANCGEDVLDENLDDKTLDLFYNEYRKRENLLLPNEIRDIRTKYGLSQAVFAKLLGFGEKTITRYENGAIQDVCHDNLIRLMRSTETFSALWETRKQLMSSSVRRKVNGILSNNNRASIQSSYAVTPIYTVAMPVSYWVNQGGMLNAE